MHHICNVHISFILLVYLGDWTTSLPEDLWTKSHHSWKMINCTYDFDNDPVSPESKLFTDDYRMGKMGRSNSTNTSTLKVSF